MWINRAIWSVIDDPQLKNYNESECIISIAVIIYAMKSSIIET